jgi:hypothetical protein
MRALLTILSFAALASMSVATAQPQFNYDASQLTTLMLPTNAVAIADVNLDGFDDLVFANGNSDVNPTADPQNLFLNNPGNPGQFTDASANLDNILGNAHMVIAEDIDEDGDPDLIFAIVGSGEQPFILVNQGGDQQGTAGVFQDDTANRFPGGLILSSRCVAGGDVDDDGDVDLVFTDSTSGPNNKRARLLINTGSGSFDDVSLTKMPNEATDAHDVVLFDFDGDLDIDITLAMQGKAGGLFGRLYLNNGNGNYTGGVKNALNGLGTSGSWETDWADLDGDGDWDATVTALSGALEGWGENLGPNTNMPETVFAGNNGYIDRELAQYDYDQDGDLDVFVAQEWLSGGVDERVYRNDGGGTFTYVPNVVEFKQDRTRDMAFADLNNDGHVDLVTAQWGPGDSRNKIYLNNGGGQGPETNSPVVLNLEQPPEVVSGGMVFQIHVQDAVVDDGKTNVSVEYAFCVSFGCPCANNRIETGEAFHQGGGMYRVYVLTDDDSTGVEVTWTVRDDLGNTTEAVVLVGTIPPGPWCDMGYAKAGVHGDPLLTGTGPLTGGSMNSVDLTNAKESTFCYLVYGFDYLIHPLKGGVLVPEPADVIPIGTNGAGSISLPMQWPLGIPGGTALYIQYWISDDTATHDWAVSNGLMAIGMDP